MEIHKRNITPKENQPDNGYLPSSLTQIDAFNKLPKECLSSTPEGGGISILTFGAIFVLVIAECIRFLNPEVQYQFSVDPSIDGILNINVDLTVAMKCSDVTLDVVDANGKGIGKNSNIKSINSIFSLSSKKRKKFDYKKKYLSNLREEHHSINELLWLTKNDGFFNFGHKSQVQEIEATPKTADACRFVGSFKVNKAQGNMHLTTGKALDINMNIHIHISPLFGVGPKNYSHRIHHLSFGPIISEYLNPLDSSEVISKDASLMYQYFIQVVPTTYTTRTHRIKTYQYAVTEQGRSSNNENSTGGSPGLFFRYDFSPVKVDMLESGDSLVWFLVRLAAIVGGVFATANFVCQLFTHLLPTFIHMCESRKNSRVGVSTDEPLIPESEL